MTTVAAAGARKAMGEDAAFEVFAKRLADVGAWCVVVALAVELAYAGQLKPCLEVFGDGVVQQGSLGMTRVVEPGFGVGTRVRTSG